MAIELIDSHPRRAILAAAGGALAALVAQALGRPLPARAEGEIIHVGDEHTTAQSVTKIQNKANNLVVLMGESTGSGTGVYGLSGSGAGALGWSSTRVGLLGVSGDSYPGTPFKTAVYGYAAQDSSSRGVWGESTLGRGVHGSSASNTGVRGESNSSYGVYGSSSSSNGVTGSSSSSIGVYGLSTSTDKPASLGQSAGGSTGVQGVSGSGTPPAPPAKTGVYGYAVQDAGSRGVWGRANAGFGVYGQATSGRGVRGTAGSGKGGSFQAASGIALHAKGRVQLETSSGTATIAAGTRSKTVTPGFGLTSASKVLVTLNGNPGGATVLQRVAINATADRFTVYLTANAANNTRFAWLVLV